MKSSVTLSKSKTDTPKDKDKSSGTVILTYLQDKLSGKHKYVYTKYISKENHNYVYEAVSVACFTVNKHYLNKSCIFRK